VLNYSNILLLEGLMVFKFITILSLSLVSSWAQLPNIAIQFGGPLNESCSFVNNDDVIASLQSTLTVLGQIEESEVACQNLLINSRAFLDSSLQTALQMQKQLFS
jgi:hypothetical protein